MARPLLLLFSCLALTVGCPGDKDGGGTTPNPTLNLTALDGVCDILQWRLTNVNNPSMTYDGVAHGYAAVINFASVTPDSGSYSIVMSHDDDDVHVNDDDAGPLLLLPGDSLLFFNEDELAGPAHFSVSSSGLISIYEPYPDQENLLDGDSSTVEFVTKSIKCKLR